MIKINNVHKSFNGVEVLKDITLEIKKGEVFGLVGHSGAGKSTLLRCINGLETYDKGSILVNEYEEVKELSNKSVRSFRKNLGMIFQHFSLLERRNVYDNVALPLECWGYSKADIDKRVSDLLELVGLSDKKKSKPRELSGGQKQRVAIARALALNPNILLCDEATSALDPNTTKSILALLRDINEKLGITIIIVTHQMEVVKEICQRVAIMEGGQVIAVGKTEDLFLKNSKALKTLIGEEEILPNEGINIRLFFPKDNSNDSIITAMARELDIDFSIVWGKLERFRDDVLGSLVINIKENQKDEVVKYLTSKKYAMGGDLNGEIFNLFTDILIEALGQTIYMVGISTILATLIGFILAIVLVVTDEGGLKPNKIINSILGFIVNTLRSFPFIILVVAIIPLTRAIVGKSIGETAALVPLTIGAAPFIARVIEGALKEVDKGLIEAAKSFGASDFQIIFKVMVKEAMPSIISGITLSIISIIGYSAMAGAVGAGGVGAVALTYGYQRFDNAVMIYTVITLIIIVQLLQGAGNLAYKKLK